MIICWAENSSKHPALYSYMYCYDDCKEPTVYILLHYSLELKDAMVDDSGIYILKVSNDYGATQNSANILVKGMLWSIIFFYSFLEGWMGLNNCCVDIHFSKHYVIVKSCGQNVFQQLKTMQVRLHVGLIWVTLIGWFFYHLFNCSIYFKFLYHRTVAILFIQSHLYMTIMFCPDYSAPYLNWCPSTNSACVYPFCFYLHSSSWAILLLLPAP